MEAWHANHPERFLYRLRDGTEVLVRPVIPEDKDRLRAGIARMSPGSRIMRFFSGLSHLSEERLRYFTEVDQVNHIAWCAGDPAVPEIPGVGLGRYVREAPGAAVAELALAVIDEYQGRGLGTMLLAVLYLVARRSGLGTLRAIVLNENEPMVRWLRGLGASEQEDGETLRMDLAVGPGPLRLPRTTSGRRLRQAMEELVRIKPEWGEGLRLSDR